MNLDFDTDKYIRFTLPTFLRKPIIRGFLKVLITSVTDLFASTKSFYLQVVAELQTSILTDVLQNKLRTLYPDVGAFKVFVKTQWDNFPRGYSKFLGEHQKPEFDGYLSEIVTPVYDAFVIERDLAHDYYVVVPTAYTANQTAIEFILNKFKPAGKRYLLIFDDITI